HAGFARGGRGCSAGGLSALARRRSGQGGECARLPGEDGGAALPRPAEVGAGVARDLCRPLAARTAAGGRRLRGRQRERLCPRPVGGADAGAGASVAARARRLPAARRVRHGVRAGRGDAWTWRAGLPAAPRPPPPATAGPAGGPPAPPPPTPAAP